MFTLWSAGHPKSLQYYYHVRDNWNPYEKRTAVTYQYLYCKFCPHIVIADNIHSIQQFLALLDRWPCDTFSLRQKRFGHWNTCHNQVTTFLLLFYRACQTSVPYNFTRIYLTSLAEFIDQTMQRAALPNEQKWSQQHCESQIFKFFNR